MVEKIPKTNVVLNRLLFLSPTVSACLEPEASFSDFIKESPKPIGKGGFGEVFKVRHRGTNNIYVIKLILKQSIIQSDMVDQLNREVDIMYKANHPHIIKIINHFEDDDYFYIVLEYAENGQLYDQVKIQKKLPIKEAARYVRETLLALKYLHTAFDTPIIHRDIKPENILLDENKRVKLADFGWANFESNDRQTYCGTAEYLSPEMVNNMPHSKAVDIWSIGVLLFELLAGYSPFLSNSHEKIFLNIKLNAIKWPKEFDPLAKELIKAILVKDESKRLSIDDILNHEFFKENKSDLEELQPKKMNRKEFLKSLMLKEVTKPGSGKEETLDLVVVAHYKEIIRKLTSNYETKLQVKDEEAEQQREEFKESIKLYELKVKQLRKDLLERQIELKSVSVLKAQIETLSEELEQAKANNKHLEEDKEELSYKLAKAKNELASYLKEVQEAKTVVKERNYTIEMLRMEQTLAEKRKSDDLAGYIKKLEHIQSLFLEETLEEIETPVSKKLIESLKLEIYEMTGSLKSNIECLDATMKEISKAWQSDKAAIENSLAIKHESLKSELLELETNLNLEVRKLHGLAENSNRKDTRVAWFKEKVRELVKFKEQCVEKDHIAEKLRKNLEIAQEKLSVLEESSTNLKRNVKLKDEAIQKVNKDKESLENRISDMKLFFFTKFPDHLEVFQDYFKRKR